MLTCDLPSSAQVAKALELRAVEQKLLDKANVKDPTISHLSLAYVVGQIHCKPTLKVSKFKECCQKKQNAWLHLKTKRHGGCGDDQTA